MQTLFKRFYPRMQFRPKHAILPKICKSNLYAALTKKKSICSNYLHEEYFRILKHAVKYSKDNIHNQFKLRKATSLNILQCLNPIN